MVFLWLWLRHDVPTSQMMRKWRRSQEELLWHSETLAAPSHLQRRIRDNGILTRARTARADAPASPTCGA